MKCNQKLFWTYRASDYYPQTSFGTGMNCVWATLTCKQICSSDSRRCSCKDSLLQHQHPQKADVNKTASLLSWHFRSLSKHTKQWRGVTLETFSAIKVEDLLMSRYLPITVWWERERRIFVLEAFVRCRQQGGDRIRSGSWKPEWGHIRHISRLSQSVAVRRGPCQAASLPTCLIYELSYPDLVSFSPQVLKIKVQSKSNDLKNRGLIW